MLGVMRHSSFYRVCDRNKEIETHVHIFTKANCDDKMKKVNCNKHQSHAHIEVNEKHRSNGFRLCVGCRLHNS